MINTVIALVLLASVPSLAHPHHLHLQAEPAPQQWQPLPTDPVIGGQGNWRYQFMPDLVQLPPSVQMRNGHGLAVDSKGRIYFTYESEKITADTRVLVRFQPDGTQPELLGPDNALAFGTPHGLRLVTEADGSVYLYHANNDHTIHKTTLEGEILWTNNNSLGANTSSYQPFNPTDAVGVPVRDAVYIGDGYGSSYIHILDSATGKYRASFGGQGSVDGKFNCPHGINVDPRDGVGNNNLLISNRGNSRLDYFTLDGKYISTVTAPNGTTPSPIPALPQPCNVNYLEPTTAAAADNAKDNAKDNDVITMALVPDLSGPVGILDGNNTLVSIIDMGKLLGPSGYVHPHDGVFLPNGDIVVCFWNPGRLSYWKRLPPQ